MSHRVARAAALYAGLAFAVACGGNSHDLDASRSLAAGGARAAKAAQPAASVTNRPPEIRSLSFSPPVPVSEGALEARVDASDPDGNLVQFLMTWKLNGRVIEEGARSAIQLPALERGDRIELTVVANDGTLESEPRTISARFDNRPPEITFLYVTPQNKKIRRGDVLTAVPEASDPEDDRLEYSYLWRVNGAEAGTERQLDTRDLRRGDKVTVEVKANDGFLESAPRTTLPIVLENSPPVIAQMPKLEHQGGTLAYQFEAEDPEGDRNLRFFLKDAPEGMEIDAITGRLTWTPSAEQAGKHIVHVGVKDSEGDASLFDWEVSVSASDAPAAPAPTE
jgi:hypothetical protein